MSESVGMAPQSALAIVVAAPVGGIYDYLAGPAVGAVRGTIVMVPFGGRHLPGIVMGAAIGDLPVTKLRAVKSFRASLPANAATGPAIGDRLPDFSLPDAFGRVVNFHGDRGGSKAALVFYRSAVW